LRKLGINPYPSYFDKKNSAAELQKKYVKLKKEQATKDKAKIAGRLISVRDLGKIAFAKFRDSSGDIQVVFQEKETPKKAFDFFKRYIDSGDIVGVEGRIIRTRTGELSVLVKDIEMLSKSILPLPEKWHGLQDEEEKYRKRYLDLIIHPEVRELFRKKYLFWKTIREFLESREFIEVETPVLENTTGGADARPFVTHHNALDTDVYLRISMGELWQKRLMVAGFEKTFEIGRQFRNEGMSVEHLQDYSQMEFYWAYASYEQGMELVEEMYKEIAKKVIGTLKFKAHGFDVDLGKPWKRIDYLAEIKKNTGIDFFQASVREIEKKLDELKMEHQKGLEKERLIDILWKYCRKQIPGPAFVLNLPVEVSPLAKRSNKNSKLVERFFVLIAGSELGNGYSELNDPIDQEERFMRQAEMRKKGDIEAQMHDEEFVEALKYGMPPTCGFGVSERLFAFLVNKPVRECVLFPLLKPRK
jgi:lysyl-tRNA synthetase class 2